MAEPAQRLDDFTEPDVSHLVTEDDAPVDNPFQDRQMRLLTSALFDSWPYPERRFVAFSDVGLRAGIEEHAVVPDVMLTLDISAPPGEWWEKRNRSYFIWRYKKPPDAVIEIVSSGRGGENEKLPRYASMGVRYVVIYDPHGYLGARPLRAYELRQGRYVSVSRASRPPPLARRVNLVWLPEVKLGLKVWKGVFEGSEEYWLRWCDGEGALLALGRERAEQERARAEEERVRAEEERARADRLAQRLRQLGLTED